MSLKLQKYTLTLIIPLENATLERVLDCDVNSTHRYGILAMQLLLTAFVSYECMYNASINTWILSHSNAVMIPSFIVGICLIFALHCYKNKYPTNYYLLFAFTLAESLMIGLVCAAYVVFEREARESLFHPSLTHSTRVCHS